MCLSENFGSTAKCLFENQVKNMKKDNTCMYARCYSLATKQFTMTLHYYSPKAYNFVRKILKLPHASSIKAWPSTVDCEPSYLANVIKAVGQLVARKTWKQDVVLVVDAMSLHKMTLCDQSKKSFVGLVGFMIVGLTGKWKYPVAYVLQDKCSADVQAQLITDCIGLLNEEGITVNGLVFDGSPTNSWTARKSGCKMNVANPKYWFSHPQ